MTLPPQARRRTGALVAAVLAGAALLTAAPAAPADPAYPASPTTVVDGIEDQFLGNLEIAVDSADRTTLVYEDGFDEQISSGGLHAIRIAANGTIGPSQPIKTSSRGFDSIDVATDSKGNAVIVWQRSLGNSEYVAEYARITAAGAVGTPIRLSEVGRTSGAPRVAIDSLDRAHIVWTENDGAVRIRTAMLGADGQMAVPAHFVSQEGKRSVDPQLAIDGDDAVTIAWRLDDSSGLYVQATRLAAGGAWNGTVATLASTTLFASPPAVAAGPDGRSTLVWTQRDSTTEDVEVRARRLAADGSALGTVQTLSEPDASHSAPLVEIDGHDRSVVVWSRAAAGGAQLKSRRMRGDGSLETVQHLTPSGAPSLDHDMAIDSSNRTVVTWIHGNLSNSVDLTVRTRRIGNDGVPQDGPHTLSVLEAGRPVVAFKSGDRPVHAWQRDNNPTGDEYDEFIEMTVGSTTLDADEGPVDGDPGTTPPPDEPPAGPGPGPTGPTGPTGPGAPLQPPSTPRPGTPTGQATVRRNQQPGQPLEVRVIPSANGHVVASATQIVTFRNGRAASVARTKTLRLKLRRVRKSVRAGQPVKLVLKPASRKQARKVARAAKRGRATATATVKLEFHDLAGNRSVRTLRVKLAR